MSILHGKGQLNLKNCRKELRINLNIQRQALKIIQRNLVYESDHLNFRIWEITGGFVINTNEN